MRLLFDFLPILIFFIVYKCLGLYAATIAAMLASVLQVLLHWFREQTIPLVQLLSLLVIALLGGSTLIFHNELFIKWKPTVLYWVLALVCLLTQCYSRKPLIQRLLETSVTLPRSIWLTINRNWACFSILMGILNLCVAYQYDTNTWVNFKLFGLLGTTLLFTIIQACYLARFIKTTESS